MRETCPICEKSQRDPQHPEYYVTIGMEHPDLYDGVLYYKCPFCRSTWHRWEEGDPLRELAKPYIVPVLL
jgi:hypothetical protein